MTTPPNGFESSRRASRSVIANCPPSGIRRFFDIAQQMENVISLGVGEPDFVTPWRIREAGIWSLERGYTTYTSNSGLLSLGERICASWPGGTMRTTIRRRSASSLSGFRKVSIWRCACC